MLLSFLNIFGTIIFAITGVLVAVQKKMDLFGVIVIATVTAIGGGTFRDILLANYPIFWIKEPIYLIIPAVSGIVTFFMVTVVRHFTKVLLIFDAMGLAVFGIIGAQKSMMLHQHFIISLLMGIMTGVVGGMIRDILCGEVPVIMGGDIYATACGLGVLIFLILSGLGLSFGIASTIGILIVFLTRLGTIRWGWHLPSFKE